MGNPMVMIMIAHLAIVFYAKQFTAAAAAQQPAAAAAAESSSRQQQQHSSTAVSHLKGCFVIREVLIITPFRIPL